MTCRHCNGKGVDVTGNNDLACFKCPVGMTALFNSAWVPEKPITGFEAWLNYNPCKLPEAWSIRILEMFKKLKSPPRPFPLDFYGYTETMYNTSIPPSWVEVIIKALEEEKKDEIDECLTTGMYDRYLK